jgi:hypothetical protein
MVCGSMTFPCWSTSRDTSSQPSSSCAPKMSAVTDLAGSSGDGMPDSRSYVQWNSTSNMRPPRIV